MRICKYNTIITFRKILPYTQTHLLRILLSQQSSLTSQVGNVEEMLLLVKELVMSSGSISRPLIMPEVILK